MTTEPSPIVSWEGLAGKRLIFLRAFNKSGSETASAAGVECRLDAILCGVQNARRAGNRLSD